MHICIYFIHVFNCLTVILSYYMNHTKVNMSKKILSFINGKIKKIIIWSFFIGIFASN